MSGKFSKPRPHRDEERQIEESFRKVTGQDSPGVRFREKGNVEYTPGAALPPEDLQETVQIPIPEADAQETFFLPIREVPEAPKPQAKSTGFTDSMAAILHELDDLEAPREKAAPPEEDEPLEPDLVDKLTAWWETVLDYAGKNRRTVLITLCALALLMICGFMGVLFGTFSDPYDKKILDNVTIVDVQVGGMTKKEATNAVKKVADNLFAQPMIVDLSGNQIPLNPKEVKVKFNVKAAVEAAYDYGRSGTNAENQQAYILSKTTVYAVPLTERILEVDESYIRAALSAYAEGEGAALTQTSYGLDGLQPPLAADKFNEDAPGQTLVITMGTPGVGFDVADVTRQVVDSYRQRIFLVKVENVEVTRDPDPIDLRAIWEEYHIDPINAAIDPETKEAVPGFYGYTFDLEEAQKLVEEAQFGEEIRIPMTYVEPEILDASAFYRDTLGEHQTKHNGDNTRTKNLQLACEAINGAVVEPGATFSFNETTGKRNSAKGYKEALDDTTKYAEKVNAGGVSQVSSTLYYAALAADMEITARTAGTYAPGFIELGMDAMVSSSRDFAFRNPHTYPVRIEAQVSGGYVKIQILGTEEREYYVILEQSIEKTIKPEIVYEDFSEVNPDGWEDGDVVEEGITGYHVKSFRVRHDRLTNAQLSRDTIATTKYESEKKTVAKVEVPETTEATQPPTTAPTETTVPTTSPTEATTQETQETQETQSATQETIEPPTENSDTPPEEDDAA